jgi:hypothetical protein
LPRPSLLGLLSFTHLRDSALTAFKARPNRSVKPAQDRKKEPAGKTPVKCTANEGPAKIQYKCLVSIYVFSEMKLLYPTQNYNVLSPGSYTHISVRDLYISRIGLPILL